MASVAHRLTESNEALANALRAHRQHDEDRKILWLTWWMSLMEGTSSTITSREHAHARLKEDLDEFLGCDVTLARKDVSSAYETYATFATEEDMTLFILRWA